MGAPVFHSGRRAWVLISASREALSVARVESSESFWATAGEEISAIEGMVIVSIVLVWNG